MADWVRLWNDMPTDPKWRVISRKSGEPLACVIALFTLLMATASAADDRGDISGLSVEDAAAALDIDEGQVAAILREMEGRVIENGRLSGWDRRQPSREDDSAERVRRHRAAKRKIPAKNETQRNAVGEQVTQSNASVTQRNAPDTDTDTEKKKERGGAVAQTEFAFVGKIIRLKPDDFERWRKAYHAIPDMMAELTKADDYYSEKPPDDGKWFFPVSKWLEKAHRDALKAGVDPDEEIYRGVL